MERPFLFRGGVLRALAEGLEFYEELRTVVPDEVSATFYVRAEWADHQTRGGLPIPLAALTKVAPLSIDTRIESSSGATSFPQHHAAFRRCIRRRQRLLFRKPCRWMTASLLLISGLMLMTSSATPSFV
jgi:hypothetical protein